MIRAFPESDRAKGLQVSLIGAYDDGTTSHRLIARVWQSRPNLTGVCIVTGIGKFRLTLNRALDVLHSHSVTLTLQLACVDFINTVTTSHKIAQHKPSSAAIPIPRVQGAAMRLRDGMCVPARWLDRGPDIDLRMLRCIFSEPSLPVYQVGSAACTICVYDIYAQTGLSTAVSIRFCRSMTLHAMALRLSHSRARTYSAAMPNPGCVLQMTSCCIVSSHPSSLVR